MQSFKYEVRYDPRSRLEEGYGRLHSIYLHQPVWLSVSDFFTTEVGEQAWTRINDLTWREALDALG